MNEVMNSDIINLIKNHENQNVEFKESFRWNHYYSRIDRNISKKITSSICGFLTSKEGGKIIVGVEDNRNIIGIKLDIESYNKNDPLNGKDCLLADVGKIIKENIGIQVIFNCSISFRNINDKEILLINVKPYNGPVIHLKRDLYVRVANTTRKLIGREAYNYLKTNYDYKKFRLDLEFVFFNAMRYFRLARNIMYKKREKYYSLIILTFFFNLYWYIYLFYDYTNSQYQFPITFLTIFLLSLNFNIDLLSEYKTSSEFKKKSYTPDPSKKLVIGSILILIIISGLLGFSLINVINLMLSSIKFSISYSLIFLIMFILYLVSHRIFKKGLIDMENLNKYLPIKSDKELEI